MLLGSVLLNLNYFISKSKSDRIVYNNVYTRKQTERFAIIEMRVRKQSDHPTSPPKTFIDGMSTVLSPFISSVLK